MKPVSIYVFFAATVAVAMCTKFSMDNPTITSYNPKYFKDLPVYTVTKNADDDGFTIHLEGENLITFDDKVIVTLVLSLKNGDHFEPTGLSLKFKLCQFFKDLPIAKMIMEQLPSMKCPFPAQKHSFTFQSVPIKHLPFVDKFESSLKTGIKIDIIMEMDNKEPIVSGYTEFKIL